MIQKPLISIVIPAYNYADKLPRAVMSVLSQLQQEYELIVINDGSTDHTRQVLEALETQSGEAFRVVHKENGGLASVRNRGLQEAAADYLLFLDADDELADGALEALSEHLRGNPGADMVIGGSIAVWPDGKQRKTQLPQALPADPLARVKGYLIDKTITPSNGATLMHRRIFVHGLYPEQFRNAEDIPVFAQALANTCCTVLPVPLALIHKHAGSLRHNTVYDTEVGLHLVDEVFETGRLDERFHVLKQPFLAQRTLSLFRGLYMSGQYAEARQMYHAALRHSWTAVFKLAYTRKYLKILFK